MFEDFDTGEKLMFGIAALFGIAFCCLIFAGIYLAIVKFLL